MLYRHSIRFRMAAAFCFFGAVLGLMYSSYVIWSTTFVEDDMFDHQLKLVLEEYLVRYGKDEGTPLPNPPNIKAYIGLEAMTGYERKLSEGLSEGFHEYTDEDYHVGVKILPGTEKILYLIYDVSSLEIHDTMIYKLAIILTIGLLLIVAAGGWLGLITSRRLIAPVVQLAEIVKKAGPDNLPTDLSSRFHRDDEVGVLARALERAMERVQALMEREKIFTRDASHELRTPVTVIKGAVGVLERKYGKDEGPLQRINRSVKDMENTIESLLLLAREEAVPAPGENCAGAPVIRKAIDQNRYLLTRKPVAVSLVENAAPVIQAPAGIFQIAVTNLIRNAFTCTAEGKITVTIHDDHVEVADTGRGVPEKDLPRIMEPHARGSDSHGFGLGLSIVKRLCNRFGWNLAIDSREGSGTRVRLIFAEKVSTPRVEKNFK